MEKHNFQKLYCSSAYSKLRKWPKNATMMMVLMGLLTGGESYANNDFNLSEATLASGSSKHPTENSFSNANKVTFLRPLTTSHPELPARLQQEKFSVKGVIVDVLGNKIAGVVIRESGTQNATSSDDNGEFSLTVNSANAVLDISYIGFQTIVGLPVREEMEITLQEDDTELDEVVVVGYGSQRKVSVVGAVQSVKPEELRTPSSNLSNSFAGRLSGVVAFQRTGQPGADGSDFYIRGISTFSGATNPLIIVDGVAVSQGDLNSIAPEVIESFSILKDATATAIYGSRGANGVMIVTTKSGRDLDKARLNFRLENSLSAPTSVPKFANAATFMELYNEAVVGRSTGEILYTPTQINGAREKLDPLLYPDVDWYDELFKPAAMNQTFNMNVTGGGKRVDYFMSGTLNRDNGVLRKFNLNSYDNNIKVNRYTFQNNINAKLSNTTKVGLRLNTQLRNYNGPAVGARDLFGFVMEANPADFPVMYPGESETGGMIFGGKSGGRVNDGYINPFAELIRGYSTDFQSTVMANFDVEEKMTYLLDGLTFKGLVSFKNWSQTATTRSRGYNTFIPRNIVDNGDGTYEYDLERVGNVQGETLSTSNSTTGDRTLYFQASLDYNKYFDRHNVSGLLLYNQQDYNVNSPDGLIASLPKRSQGFAGRATYSYDDKYFAEMNFGYNGSENFAKGKRFGFFPSAAVGYVVSNEDYFKNYTDVVSLLKLRASWGLVGNDQIGGARFVYLSDLDLGGQGYTTGINQDYSKSGPAYKRFQNNNITWEVAEKVNLGMDISFANKFNLVVDAFQEHRTGIFLERKVIPTSFGTSGTTVYGNLGEVKNRGFDLSLDYHTSFSDNFSMQLKGTFTYARNKILDIDEPAFTTYKNLSQVGRPINSLLGYVAERLFIDDAEVANSPIQQLGGFIQAGDIKYKDLTNDIDGLNMINSDDREYMGYPTVPEVVYGFAPSFTYKNLDFSVFFQGIARTSFFINGFHPFGSSSIRNVMDYVVDNRWSPENPDIYAEYPRLSKLDNGNNTQNSSYWLRDGSFLKLRNAEIGYRYKIARIYLSGTNLLTFSKFKLWDPEQGGGNGLTYPTQRVVNFGVQLSL